MSSFTTKIKKLRGLSVDEIGVRMAQQVAILSERGGWSKLTNLPSDEHLLKLMTAHWQSTDALVQHLRTRVEPHFFASFASKAETLSELRSRWPNAEPETISAADRICEGTFAFLGLRELKLGNEIDWHLEPRSGKRTPLRHWSQVDYLDVQLAGDKKFTWELNRHQYFVILGRAYWLTGDERYAEVFVSHLTSWMDHNPPKLGINWASSLEIALRSMSWLWALHFFKDSSSLTDALVVRMLKFLYLNALHLKTFLSTYFSPNTHITGEALGLFYIGMLLPEFDEAADWRRLGLGILVDELLRQVQADGVYFEQTSYYQRYTTDFYIHLAVLLQLNTMTLPPELKPKLELLLNFLMYITRPDGTTPFVGDDDGGRLVMLDNRPPNDFRAALSTAAVLFNRPDYKFVSGGAAEETLWLLGVKGLRLFDQIEAKEPEHESIRFPTGGYYVMRDGWSRQSNYMLFDCGPHGMANCGHAHADALAFNMAANGRTLLVDPGTFTYTGAKEARNWFRSSVAHNTLTVDRQSSSIPGDTFTWKTITPCEGLGWIDHKRFAFVSGLHRGFERLSRPGIHNRSILFLKNDYWIIRDRIEVTGKHQIDLWFHFESGTSPAIREDEAVQWVHENGARIASFAPAGRWAKEEGWVSHCYGERATAPVCVFSAEAEGTFDVVTFLLPDERRVHEVEVSGGRGFEVQSEHSRDLLVVKDMAYTWQRTDVSGGAPKEELTLSQLAERVEYSFSSTDSV